MKNIQKRKTHSFIFLVLMLIVITGTGCACASNVTDSLNSKYINETEFSSTVNSTISPAPTTPIKREFERIEKKSQVTVVNGKSNAVVFGMNTAVEVEGAFDSAQYSINSPRVAMLFDRGDDGTGRLLFFDGNQTAEVALDVYSFQISCDGYSIAYLKGSLVEGVGSDLYIYDCKTGETHLVAESAGGQFVLSPKGKAIAFIVYEEIGNSDTWGIYLSVNGETPEKLGGKMSPTALTDDGLLVYAIGFEVGEGNIDLIVFHEQKLLKLSSLLKQRNSIILYNNDCSQVLFSDEEGLQFYQSGKEVKLIEPVAEIVRLEENCKADEYYFYNGYSQSQYPVIYYSVYSGTTNLYNVLYQIEYQDQNVGNLMYLSNDLSIVLLTSFWRGNAIDQVGNSILVFDKSNEQNSLIYVEDIYSPQFEEKYDSSSEKHFDVYFDMNYYLTSGGTIYYYSGLGGKDERINGSMGFSEMSSIKVDGDAFHDVISPNCVRMEKFEREGAPDTIYYLEYKFSEPQTTVNEKEYVSWYYYDLYMIEDVPSATPVLIAENVGDFGCGDYGVYYLQLESVGPDVIESMRSNDASGLDIYDKNKLYWSSDGHTFEYQTNIDKVYCMGG